MLIQANADSPEEARAARASGAPGIGLCRTEPMLLAPAHLALMRTIASAPDVHSRDQALKALLPMHQASLSSIFRIMAPSAVSVRLIDPPLHTFLPTIEQLDADLGEAKGNEDWDEMMRLGSLRRLHRTVIASNPSMGHRGCRLSLTHPEILRMQVTAILRASQCLFEEGISLVPGIVIPLVASEEEARFLAETVRQFAAEVSAQCGRKVPYRLGVLIEVPRAVICAGRIADHVDFVSFGTNDLTQMTYGFSKEETRTYLDVYLEKGIFDWDPFTRLDLEGVGQLISMAMHSIRRRHPDMEIGACGDHCADPEALRFFRSLGISFASCAPQCVAAAREILDQISAENAGAPDTQQLVRS